MKKYIATLLVAILALGSVSAFALEVTDSATAIKKAATEAIKAYNNGGTPSALDEIKDLLSKVSTVPAKQQSVILNAIKTALNTATLKSYAASAADQLNALTNITVTKAAGGKYNIQVVETDTTTGSVIKEDIPKAAVEKPTLSTDPTVNAR